MEPSQCHLFFNSLEHSQLFPSNILRGILKYSGLECYLNVPSSILKGLLWFSICLKHYAFLPFFFPLLLGARQSLLVSWKEQYAFQNPLGIGPFSPASTSHNYGPNCSSCPLQWARPLLVKFQSFCSIFTIFWSLMLWTLPFIGKLFTQKVLVILYGPLVALLHSP